MQNHEYKIKKSSKTYCEMKRERRKHFWPPSPLQRGLSWLVRSVWAPRLWTSYEAGVKPLQHWLSNSNIAFFLTERSRLDSDKLKMDSCWGQSNQNILEFFFFAVRAVSAQSPHFYYLAENDNKDPPCLGVKSHIHLNWRLAGSCGMEMDLKPFTGGSWQAQWKRTSSSPILAHIAWKSSVKIFFFPPAYLRDGGKKGCLSSSVYI